MGIFKRLFGKRPSGKDIQRVEQMAEQITRDAARKRNGDK
jgi:hypothetical protein